MAGIRDADFEETAPASPALLISRLACSLAGAAQEIFVAPSSAVFGIYKQERVTEQFTCSYGLNEAYRKAITRGGLSIVGDDSDGNARILEVGSHPFFVATLFLPQLSSRPGTPHPLIVAFLKAATAFRTSPAREE